MRRRRGARQVHRVSGFGEVVHHGLRGEQEPHRGQGVPRHVLHSERHPRVGLHDAQVSGRLLDTRGPCLPGPRPFFWPGWAAAASPPPAGPPAILQARGEAGRPLNSAGSGAGALPGPGWSSGRLHLESGSPALLHGRGGGPERPQGGGDLRPLSRGLCLPGTGATATTWTSSWRRPACPARTLPVSVVGWPREPEPQAWTCGWRGPSEWGAPAGAQGRRGPQGTSD